MEVRILGPLEVWLDGQRIELAGGRQRVLLAILVLNLNDVVSSDRLIDDLWNERPPPTAAKALQNLIVQLRNALDPARTGVLVTQPPGYVLRLEDDAVDARRFERLAAEGRRLLGEDPALATERLHAALELWRGEPLADIAYEPSVQDGIAHLAELRLVAVEDRIEADLALGREADVVADLRGLVAAHVFRERLRGQLMVALYRCGRQSEALEVFTDGRRLLHEDLGLEPGPALRELQQAILNHDPSLGRSSGASRAIGRGRRRPVGLALASLVAAVAVLMVVLGTRERSGASVPVVVPDSLVRIDAATNEIVDVQAVGTDPGQVETVGDYVVVASEGDQTISRLDLRSGTVTTSGALSAGGPLAAAGEYVWVTSESRAEVVRVHVERLTPIDRVRLRRDLLHAFIAVGDGSLWVSEYAPPAIVRYSLRTLRLERRYPLEPTAFPVEVAYGERSAWIGLAATDHLLEINGRTGETTRIPVGSGPSDPTVGFGSVWVGTVEGGVWRVDPLTHRTLAVVDLEDVAYGLAIGAGSVWVTGHCRGTVSRIDPATNMVVATIETGYYPKWLAVGGDDVWVGVAGERAFDFETCD